MVSARLHSAPSGSERPVKEEDVHLQGDVQSHLCQTRH